jgi:hypothetical protein
MLDPKKQTNTNAASPSEDQRQVARPLKVLVPLIQKDLLNGKAAAEEAGLPYYKAAGEKLREAKGQMKHGEFTPWIKKNFKLSERTARVYMGFSKATEAVESQNGSALPFSSLRDAQRQQSKRLSNEERENIGRRKKDLDNRIAEDKSYKRICILLIDTGYKTMAIKLHPDKGGSANDMVLLSRARTALKASLR